MDICAKGDYVFTMDGRDTVYENGVVCVRQNAVAYVGEEENMPAEFQSAPQLGGKGHLILPGMINAHTHLPMSLMRGLADNMLLNDWLTDRIWPLEDRLQKDDCYFGTLLSIAEMFRCGVTCVNDMYFFHEEIASAVLESGMRGILSCCVMDAAPGGEERLAKSIAFFNEYDGAADGRIRVSMAPHAEYTCSLPYLVRCAEAAKGQGCNWHMHISETESEHLACKERHGKTPIELLAAIGALDLPVTAAHCVHVEEGDIALMAEHGAGALHCPSSNMKLGSGFAPVPKMLEAGVHVALGTDGAASNNSLDVWKELSLAALIHKGVARDARVVDAKDAVRMATSMGAKALHMDGIGSLEAGKRADLVAISLDAPHYHPETDLWAHLAYSGNSPDVVLTMIDGKIVYDRGAFPTMDIPRIYARVGEIADRLDRP